MPPPRREFRTSPRPLAVGAVIDRPPPRHSAPLAPSLRELARPKAVTEGVLRAAARAAMWFAVKPKVPTRRAEGSPPYGCGTVIAPILPTCVGRGAPTPPRIPHQPPTPRRRGGHRPPAPAPQREFQSCRRHTALLTSSLLPITSLQMPARALNERPYGVKRKFVRNSRRARVSPPYAYYDMVCVNTR